MTGTSSGSISWSERGSALPFVVVLLVLLSSLLGAVDKVGRSLIEQARSDSIADLVALAAAGGDRGVAENVAESNDARLVSLSEGPDRAVLVHIAYRSRLSTAAAMSGDQP